MREFMLAAGIVLLAVLTEHWLRFGREGETVTVQEMTTATHDKCPDCGWNEPDGVHIIGSKVCLRHQNAQSRAEADHYRQRYETLRAAVEGVADLIRGAAEKARQLHVINRDPYDDGRSVGFGTAVMWLRKALAEHGGDGADGCVAAEVSDDASSD